MKIISPGCRVRFTDSDVIGRVLAVMIEGVDTVSYKVAWFNGRSRSAEWVTDHEVVAYKSEPLEVGFHTNGG